MHRTPRHLDRRPSLLAGVALVAALCAAGPATAAQVMSVRVGSHPKFTRVVFELDGAAGYKIERVGTAAAPILRVQLDASSRAHELRATGDVRGVKVEAGSRALAHIALGKPGLRLQEMILSNPPRIVLDLIATESALAAAPKTAPAPPRTAAAPARKPAVVATPARKPAPAPLAAEPPKPVVRAEVEPPPAPAPVPALNPAPRATEAPRPPAAETAQAPPPREPQRTPAIERDATAAPALTPPAEVPVLAPSPSPQGIAQVPPVAPVPPTPLAVVAPTPIRPVTPAPVPRVTPAEPSTERPSWADRLTGDPIWLGSIAAVLVAGVAIAIVVRRRARTLPNDLDVTAIAEEIEGSGRIPSSGFAMGDTPEVPSAESADATFAGLFDEPAEPTLPMLRPAPQAPSAAPRPLAPAPRAAAVPAPVVASSDTSSLFDQAGGTVGEDASEGDAPMNQDMDLPVDPRKSPPAPPPRMGGSAAPSPDMARMLQDLERRMQTLEAKLDDANESREKLERQVAAQSEELRVQRAAIARTQRALRTMSRGDEDKATEPALRDGDTQAKTRVNV